MGCCASKPPTREPLIGFQTGPLQKLSSPQGTLQAIVSTAGWLSHAPLDALTCITVRRSSFTTALFDWYSDPAAANFCRQNFIEKDKLGEYTHTAYNIPCAEQVFNKNLEQSGNVESSLQNTFKQLDQDFLACPDVPDKVKAISGVSCVVVHVDLRQQKMYSARLGGNTVALGQLLHGLAVQLTEGRFQFQPDLPMNGLSLQQIDSSLKNIGIGDGRFKSQQLAGVAYGKSKPLAWTGPRELGPLHIVSQHLTVIHEHIILGSAGFWSMLSANDAVLLSHFMTKATSVAVQSSAVHESGVPTNIAAPLIQYAKGGFGVVKARTGSRLSSDATAVVITLRWPATSFNQAFPAMKGSFLDSLREKEAPDVDTPAGRAKIRWRQVRMLLVEFVRARRRALRQKWLGIVAEAVVMGKKRAHEVEQLYWTKHQAVVKVTISGVVTDIHGKQLMQTAIPMQASAN